MKDAGEEALDKLNARIDRMTEEELKKLFSESLEKQKVYESDLNKLYRSCILCDGKIDEATVDLSQYIQKIDEVELTIQMNEIFKETINALFNTEIIIDISQSYPENRLEEKEMSTSATR